MSKNKAKRTKREEHRKDLQKKRSLEQELETIIGSADTAVQEKITEILANEQLVDIRPEGLVTKVEDGKTRIHFWP